MFKTKSLLKLSSLLVLSCGIFSCGTEHTSEAVKEEVIVDSIVTEDTGNDVTDIAYSLPSPLQIASIFKKSGMKFHEEFLTKKKDPQKYTTSVSKALNLGVYSADLSYALLNKQNQTVMEYIKLNNSIATCLGLGNAFSLNDAMKRFEKNIGNTDSLTTIMSEIQMEVDLYLEENDQKEISAIAFTGAWIEGMHIVLKANEKLKSEVLNQKFTQQLGVLESVINALNANLAKDAGIEKVLTALQKMKVTYNNLNTVKSVPADSKEKLVLTDDEITLMTKDIEQLRNQFINGEF
jgi:hypothetical protein